MIIGEHDPLKKEMYQVLDEDGKMVGEHSLSEDLLKDMYWWMLYGRKADEKALKLQRQGRMGTYAPIKGQEAANVGTALAMEKEDWMVPAFRELAAYMIRGVPLELDLLYFMGDPRGNKIPEGVNNLPIYVPVGTQVPEAAGIAMGMRLKNKPHAVLCYFGDGATSKGDFHEGLNFAGVFNAPVVFVCQNNQWAISVPREKQTASETLAQKAVAYGIPGILVDGNDVIAVYQATKEALENARKGDGPTLIEAYTYRRSMHTTADDPSRYRTEEEVEKWAEKDPIERLRAYLEGQGIWTEEWQKELEEKADEKIKEAVRKAEDMPPLDPEDMFEYIYNDMPPELKEQLEYLKKSIKEKEIEEETPEIEGGFP